MRSLDLKAYLRDQESSWKIQTMAGEFITFLPSIHIKRWVEYKNQQYQIKDVKFENNTLKLILSNQAGHPTALLREVRLYPV